MRGSARSRRLRPLLEQVQREGRAGVAELARGPRRAVASVGRLADARGARKKGHAASDLPVRAPPSPVGVAFNPYEDDMALATKLKGGGVSSVWLQFGVRLDDLDREGVELVGSGSPDEKADRASKFRL